MITKDRISEIVRKWFLCEEALFLTFCTHRVLENSNMKCPLRVGNGTIEYNPVQCDDMNEKELEERLKIETIRILLKHPYERQPDGCSFLARALGSNCVIGDSYELTYTKIIHPEDLNLPKNGHYEFYARKIQKMLQVTDNINTIQENDEEIVDLAQNWQQDELMAAHINETICNVNSWGSIPGNLVEQIKASTQARVDYQKILASFRTSILSQARKLTRMRPNRRLGFNALGSRHEFTTKLIIGVDVSGSINKETLQNFYTTINHFFQYGIIQIDVVQFDVQLREVQTITKATENITIVGRGGTAFQPFIDYISSHPEYDGAIIYTDGYAKQPTIPSSFHTPLCWILRSEEQLKKHKEWMRKSGRVCVIEND